MRRVSEEEKRQPQIPCLRIGLRFDVLIGRLEQSHTDERAEVTPGFTRQIAGIAVGASHLVDVTHRCGRRGNSHRRQMSAGDPRAIDRCYADDRAVANTVGVLLWRRYGRVIRRRSALTRMTASWRLRLLGRRAGPGRVAQAKHRANQQSDDQRKGNEGSHEIHQKTVRQRIDCHKPAA